MIHRLPYLMIIYILNMELLVLLYISVSTKSTFIGQISKLSCFDTCNFYKKYYVSGFCLKLGYIGLKKKGFDKKIENLFQIFHKVLQTLIIG